MAERTVNVNINYNVKTVEIEKLAQASMRAQQATDRLQQSSQKFNQQSSAGNMRAGQTIEGMTVQMQRLRAQINLTNVADTKRLNSLRAQYQQVKGRVDAFNKSIEDSGKKAQATQSKFGGLLNAVKLIFTAAVVRQVVDMSLGMAELAGNVESVERAFKIAFPDAEILINDLRKATKGTITDFKLMQTTLQAFNLGVDIKEFPTLLEFASLRAQQTGESVDYLVNSIVTGLGRKSTRVIDNLGISADRVKKAMNGLSLEAATAGQVTEAVAKIAREEIDKMGGSVINSATAVKNLKAEFEELKIAIAKATAEGNSGFARFLKDAVVSLREFITAGGSLEQLNKNLLKNEIEKQALETVGFVRRKAASQEFADDQQKQIDLIQQEINSRVQLVGRYNDELKKLRQTIDLGRGFGFPGFSQENQEGAKRFQELVDQYGSKAKKVFEEEIKQARVQLLARTNNKAVIEETIRLLSIYLDSVQKVTEVEAVQLGLIEEVEARIKELTESIAKSRNEQQIAKWNREVFILQGRLADLKRLGLPEFKSPEVIERIGKVLDEEVKEGAAAAGLEFLKIEETVARIDQKLRNMPKDPIPIPPPVVPKDYADLVGEAFEDARLELITGNIDITNEFLQSSLQAEVESYRLRIGELQSFYADQISLAGDNERRKEQLRIEEARSVDRLRIQAAQKEKEARRFSIVIDTAASIAKTAATLGFPAAIPFILLAVANGAAQLAALNRAQVRGFAKGEVGIDGPGTGRSDSIPAMLSKGESIINSDATKRSYNLLEAINAKKIDDRVLRDLQVTREGVRVVGMDDKRIVEAIKGQQQVDVVRIGSQLYEVKNRTATYKRYIRSKSMGK